MTEAAQVHLERLEDGGWTSLSANKAEAGEAIRDAIGLTQAQFTQVMLLRQGEFAKFLRSSGDDRQKLLTALFGTQLYDRITDELGSPPHGRDPRPGGRPAPDRRGRRGGGRGGRPGRGRPRRAAGAVPGPTAPPGWPRSPRRSRRTARRRARNWPTPPRGWPTPRPRLSGPCSDAALLRRLADALARLAGHEAGRAEHEARAARLEAARRADPVRPLLDALAEAQAALADARDAVTGRAELDVAGRDLGGPDSAGLERGRPGSGRVGRGGGGW